MINKNIFTKFIKNDVGFTLVELMVVISIIAVLSIVGLSVLSNAQRSGRDSKRIQDVQAIATVMEINYDNVAGAYRPLDPALFEGGKEPHDVFDGQIRCGHDAGGSCTYCGSNNSTPMSLGENKLACPDPNQFGTRVSPGFPEGGNHFEVCATLEASPFFYCKTNLR